MASRSPGSTTFIKVKGHATDIDVQRGRVLACDKLGNDGADACACAGADQHAVPEALLRDVTFRQVAAKGVQRMMVEILRLRRASELVRAQAADDVEPEHEMADVGCPEELDPFVIGSIPGDAGPELLDPSFAGSIPGDTG